MLQLLLDKAALGLKVPVRLARYLGTSRSVSTVGCGKCEKTRSGREISACFSPQGSGQPWALAPLRPYGKKRDQKGPLTMVFGNGMWETASILSSASFCVPYNAYVIAFLFIKALELYCWM